MFSEKLQAALNEQINAEYHSGYLYLAMAAYFDGINLDGCANWMRIQTQEEVMHGMKIFDYFSERGGKVRLTAIEAPPVSWKSPLDAFEAALTHEQYMTKRVNDLANLALEEKDHATNNLMQWYITEQVEEEANVDDIVQKLKLLGTDGPGIFMLDRELKARVYVQPAGLDTAG